MTFQAAHWLWALVALPLLALGVLAWGRSRRRAAERYADPSLLAVAPPPRQRGLQAAAAAALLLAVAAGLVALARPSVDRAGQEQRSTVMIAVDASNSMVKTDLRPSRLAAALDAARRFVDEAPDGTAVGVLTFADRIQVVQPPVDDPERVKRALAGIEDTREGTALGEAVVSGLGALRASGALDPPPASPGESAGRLLVLTDGANSILRATRPEDAAERAAAQNVPLYTILLGDDPAGRSEATPAETLSLMANRTGGVYAQTTTTEDLRAVFADIGTILAPVQRLRDLSVFAVAAALALIALAGALLVLARPRRAVPAPPPGRHAGAH